jgi:hypothetical protein
LLEWSSNGLMSELDRTLLPRGRKATRPEPLAAASGAVPLTAGNCPLTSNRFIFEILEPSLRPGEGNELVGARFPGEDISGQAHLQKCKATQRRSSSARRNRKHRQLASWSSDAAMSGRRIRLVLARSSLPPFILEISRRKGDRKSRRKVISGRAFVAIGGNRQES